MTQIKPTIPKGMRDFLPEQVAKRQYITNTITAVFKQFGFSEIQTPTMENLSVLAGKYGEEGERLMYKVLNSGDFLNKFSSDDELLKLSNENRAKFASKITEKGLRYDLTIPLARFVVMHKNDLVFPFKRFQIQNVFRADRPGKGRFREFTQCDADVIGSDALINESELIRIYEKSLQNLGIQDFIIIINNRKILSALAILVEEPEKITDICTAIDKIEKIQWDGVKTELINREIPKAQTDKIKEFLEISGNFDEKITKLKVLFSGIEVAEKGIKELEEIWELSKILGVDSANIELDLSLARGLDYYTGAIFEVKANQVQIGSIGGGGRYENLTGMFTKESMNGVGISFGVDRIYEVMEQLQLFDNQLNTNTTKVLLVNFDSEQQKSILKIATNLRVQNIATEVFHESGTKLKKQFKYADQKQIPFVCILGDEAENGEISVKNMISGEQVLVKIDDLSKYILNQDVAQN